MNAQGISPASAQAKVTIIFTCVLAALAGLMFGLDIGVISGATQFIQAEYKVSDHMIEWIVSSMMFGAAIGAAFAGWLSVRLGRKRSLILGAVLFIAGSLLCGIAWSPNSLIAARLILGLEAAAENDLAARPSHHDGEEDHEHDDFASVVIDLPEVTDVDALVASIQRLAREQNVLRAKGYIAVAGKPMRLLLQAVGERVRHQFDKPWGAGSRQSKLVVIGEHGDIDEAAIRAGLGI